MIVNKNLALVTQEITDLYWQDENNVARINRIVQYILEREVAQKDTEQTIIRAMDIDDIRNPRYKKNHSR